MGNRMSLELTELIGDQDDDLEFEEVDTKDGNAKMNVVELTPTTAPLTTAPPTAAPKPSHVNLSGMLARLESASNVFLTSTMEPYAALASAMVWMPPDEVVANETAIQNTANRINAALHHLNEHMVLLHALQIQLNQYQIEKR